MRPADKRAELINAAESTFFYTSLDTGIPTVLQDSECKLTIL